MKLELSWENLRKTFDPSELGIKTTERAEALTGIIGQERAVKSLQFGLDIPAVGFNTYVAGPPGIGKMTAVEAFLEEKAKGKETPSDWCYVNNFSDPYLPKVCRLPAGRGRELHQDMTRLIEHIRRGIPKVFESEEYTAKKTDLERALEKKRDALLTDLDQQASGKGFTLQSTPLGLAFLPTINGRPLTEKEFQDLEKEKQEQLKGILKDLGDGLKEVMKQIREKERLFHLDLQGLDRKVALYLVGGLVDDLIEKYEELSEVVEFLRSVKVDILDSIEVFKGKPGGDEALPSIPPTPWSEDLVFRKYRVNVLVDNDGQKGAPVIVEQNPSYPNLFGRIEKEAQMGVLHTDFTMIKSGSLHRANGGYLVLPAEDLIRDFMSWDALKRALRARDIQIEEPGERLGFMVTKSLRPQPIPLDVKVVLVGRPVLYHLVHTYDEDFPELFKVKADFDTRMDYTKENVQDYLSFLCMLCEKEGLKHLEAPAVGKVLEYASRLAEDQEKLSTHFGAVADLIREASFWAAQDDSKFVAANHLQKTIDEKVYRSNMIQEKIKEMVARGTILIDTEGQHVGQVNGLSVIGLGDYSFGRPSRITASIGPGREGIMDIEREVEMGGPIHSKGVLILSGYLRGKFSKDKPLSLAARLVFEQSYEGVEGDSASSTELYALLSALSGLPIRQGVAVTGSVNQHGEVQAIGGVNEKTEGFFDVCKAKGMSGEQGVIIPRSNVKNLMLREDVVEAVRSGKFHVWAVETIDEGIEILTEVPAGKRDSNDGFPEKSVNFLVENRLREFAEYLKEYRDAGPVNRPGQRARNKESDAK